MMKRFLILLITYFITTTLSAQQDPVLMTINGKEITRSEFEYIYNKNNAFNDLENKSLKDYVTLFVNFKLKVDAAVNAGIDTTKVFRDELLGYRRQLAKSYLIDEKVNEAEALEYYNKLKNRKQPGSVRVAHIYKSLPQNITNYRQRIIEQQFDSIYRVLSTEKEVDFAKMVNQYSEDKTDNWIGFLQTPIEFENVIFAMRVGEISKPFFTPQGIHIVKILECKELPAFADIKQEIMTRYLRRNGIDKGTVAIVDRLKKEYQFSYNNEAVNQLYTKGETSNALFYINNQPYNGDEFKLFAAAYPRSVKLQLEAFVTKSILDYENSQLESKYPDFRYLMQEYKDGMLLFEISNREIWNNELIDDATLESYFRNNKNKYNWDKPKFKGVIVHAKDKKVEKQVKRMLKKMPETAWNDTLKTIFNSPGNEQIVVEEGIYAFGINPFVDGFIYKSAKPHPLKDYPYSMVMGEKQRGPSSYKEIRGILASDYQNHLESLWVKQLRADATIEINHDVLKTVNNH